MSKLQNIRDRLAGIREGSRRPTSVGLSREAWNDIKLQFNAECGRKPNAPLTGEDVFGVPVTFHPGILGDFIAYDGGLDRVE